MNKVLRAKIKEEAECCCTLCTAYAYNGDPHHITKLSEEPLLRNCKKNIIWVCKPCHRKTENVPGYNRRLKYELQEQYREIFKLDKHYSVKEIAMLVQAPLSDIEKGANKRILKSVFVNGKMRCSGEDVIRFLMGGQIIDLKEFIL